MHSTPHTFLATALLFIQAATAVHAQDSRVQIPKVAFTEVRNDSLRRISAPGEQSAFGIFSDTETAIVLKFPLVNFDPASLNESTSVGISVGGFSHEATLGDAANWRSGKSKAKFPILANTGRLDDAGAPIQERVGMILYTWSDRKLIVTVYGHGIGSIVADSAAEFFANVEGSKARFLEPLEASASFGDQSGSGVLYAKGVAKKVTKKKGSGDAAQSFDLYSLQAVSFYDTVAPEVTLIDPAEGSEVDSESITLTGTAKDNVDATSALTLSKVLLNGEDVTDLVSAEFTDGDDTEVPPLAPEFTVDGLELASGVNTIKLYVTDSSGNTAVVTRHVTFTGTAADTIAPTVTITSPAEGAVVDSSTLVISGNAADNLDDASLLEVTRVLVNGVDVTGSVTWTFLDGNVAGAPGRMYLDEIELRGGANTIVITVSDEAGNTTTVTRHVTYFIQS